METNSRKERGIVDYEKMWNVIWLERGKVFKFKKFEDERSAKLFYNDLKEYYKRMYRKGD